MFFHEKMNKEAWTRADCRIEALLIRPPRPEFRFFWQKCATLAWSRSAHEECQHFAQQTTWRVRPRWQEQRTSQTSKTKYEFCWGVSTSSWKTCSLHLFFPENVPLPQIWHYRWCSSKQKARPSSIVQIKLNRLFQSQHLWQETNSDSSLLLVFNSSGLIQGAFYESGIAVCLSSKPCLSSNIHWESLSCHTCPKCWPQPVPQNTPGMTSAACTPLNRNRDFSNPHVADQTAFCPLWLSTNNVNLLCSICACSFCSSGNLEFCLLIIHDCLLHRLEHDIQSARKSSLPLSKNAFFVSRSWTSTLDRERAILHVQPGCLHLKAKKVAHLLQQKAGFWTQQFLRFRSVPADERKKTRSLLRVSCKTICWKGSEIGDQNRRTAGLIRCLQENNHALVHRSQSAIERLIFVCHPWCRNWLENEICGSFNNTELWWATFSHSWRWPKSQNMNMKCGTHHFSAKFVKRESRWRQTWGRAQRRPVAAGWLRGDCPAAARRTATDFFPVLPNPATNPEVVD